MIGAIGEIDGMVPLVGLDLDLLRAFVPIAEGNSFTRAASVTAGCETR